MQNCNLSESGALQWTLCRLCDIQCLSVLWIVFLPSLISFPDSLSLVLLALHLLALCHQTAQLFHLETGSGKAPRLAPGNVLAVSKSNKSREIRSAKESSSPCERSTRFKYTRYGVDKSHFTTRTWIQQIASVRTKCEPRILFPCPKRQAYAFQRNLDLSNLAGPWS